MNFYTNAKQRHLKLIEWLKSPESKNIDQEMKDKLFEQSLKTIEQSKKIDALLADVDRMFEKAKAAQAAEDNKE